MVGSLNKATLVSGNGRLKCVHCSRWRRVRFPGFVLRLFILSAESSPLPGLFFASVVFRLPSMPPQDSETARWFEEQVRPHEPGLRAWLRSHFPSLVDADDLVQDAFIRLLRAREAGPIENPRAFLFATARNVALDLYRHQRVITLEP